MTDKMESLFHIYDKELSIPMWQQPTSSADSELSSKSVFGSLRYGPRYLMYWSSSVRKIIAIDEAKHSGVLTGIALEVYHRDYGEWPDTLDELLPGYLTKVPVDPMTGEPALYRVVDGWPMVYSVGGDRDDDQGRLPVNRSYHDEEEYEDLPSAQTWDIKNAGDGDWVLFPCPETPRANGRDLVKQEAERAELEAKLRESGEWVEGDPYGGYYYPRAETDPDSTENDQHETDPP